jgi:hypothetical protein
VTYPQTVMEHYKSLEKTHNVRKISTASNRVPHECGCEALGLSPVYFVTGNKHAENSLIEIKFLAALLV